MEKTVAIYPGRFQPFGPHHYEAYKLLANKFGVEDTYIATSDKTDPERSPFTFEEKKQIAMSYGIPGDKIVQVRSPYQPKEVLDLYQEDTPAIFLLGEKDATRLQTGKMKKDGTPGYFAEYNPNMGELEGWPNRGYVIIAPNISKNIPGVGEMSGTNIRQAIKDGINLKQIFGDIDVRILNMIQKKLQQNPPNNTDLKNALEEAFGLKNDLNEEIVGNKIICDGIKFNGGYEKCNWSWNIEDGGDDLYICHKCGYDNEPLNIENDLNEGRYDTVSNKISSDIFRYWKTNAEDGEITFEGTYQHEGQDIYVEATLTISPEIEVFDADGGTDDQTNFIVAKIGVNPNKLPKYWSKISMTLKDIIRHEIEHLTHGDSSHLKYSKYMKNDELIRQAIKTGLLSKHRYFELEKEIDANLQGMYFRAKKEKRPFKDVIDDYLATQNLTPEQKEGILTLWRERNKALNLPLFEDESNLNEVIEGKTLYAFDLDDTLITSKSNIIVTNPTKGTFQLTPAEYALYTPGPDDELDFSEFASLNEPKVIPEMFNLFSQILTKTSKLPNAKTIILTARQPEVISDVKKFLSNKGLADLKVHAVGSSDPMEKVKVILDYIEDGYKKIRFYDDSPKNVRAVKTLDKTTDAEVKSQLISLHEMLLEFGGGAIMNKQETGRHKKKLAKLRKHMEKQGSHMVPYPDLPKTVFGGIKLFEGFTDEEQKHWAFHYDLFKKLNDAGKKYEELYIRLSNVFKDKPKRRKALEYFKNFIQSSEKMDEMYPPYKANMVQKTRYKASDTWTNDPNIKEGNLNEVQKLDFKSYKKEIIEIVKHLLEKGSYDGHWGTRLQGILYKILTNQVGIPWDSEAINKHPKLNKAWRKRFRTGVFKPKSLSTSGWAHRLINIHLPKPSGKDLTYNYYTTIAKTPQNAIKFANNIHKLDKDLVDLSIKEKQPLQYKTLEDYGAFMKHNDNLKVFYYDKSLKNEIEKIVNNFISSNGIITGERTHRHGFDDKDGKGSFGQILTTWYENKILNNLKKYGNKFTPEEWYERISSKFPEAIKLFQKTRNNSTNISLKEETQPVIGKDINPDLSQDKNSFKTFKKDIPLNYRIADSEEIIKTKEGPVKARKGDSIMTGTKGENWPIPSDKFKQTYDILGKGKASKRKIEIYAKELLEPTKVKVSWSDDLLNGNPGDYLVQYGEGDYGIVEKEIFKDTYNKSTLNDPNITEGVSNFRELYSASPPELQQIVMDQKKAQQNPEWHPEGNVLKHIITVTNRAIKNYPDNMDIILAAYFHDLGKLATSGVNPKTGHPTAYGHEKVSAELVRKYSEFISKMGANPENVEYLVASHMKIKPRTWDVMKQSKKDKMQQHSSFDDLGSFTKIDRGGLDLEETKLFSKDWWTNILQENILQEGGNIFKDQDKKITTIRINKADVDPTLKWLENIVGLDLLNNKLGSTGIKSSSGDLDIAINQEETTKDEILNKLADWAKQNHPEDDVKQWTRKTGISVHFKTPIRGDESNGYVQTDLMFGNPEWMKFALKGTGDDTVYKGVHRLILMASIAKSMGMKYSTAQGLVDRESNEVISNSPEEIATRLLGKGAKPSDLDNVESIYAKIKGHPNYEAMVADAKDNFNFKEIPPEKNILQEGARIDHAEDIVFWEGSKGALRAVDALRNLEKGGHKEVTIKWDGSPAIIFGRDENGDFILTDKNGYVAKGYDGKTKSADDLEKMLLSRGKEVTDSRRQFAGSMKSIFDEYEKAVPQDYRGLFKGDLLYYNTPPVKDKNFIFKPNIVQYAVDVDSDLGNKIGKSKTGVVIHRQVDAEGNESSLRDPDIFLGDEVLVVPPITAEKAPDVPNEELNRLEDIVKKDANDIDTLLNQDTLRKLQISDFSKILYAYTNSKVDTGLDNLGKDFEKWLAGSKVSQRKQGKITEYIAQNPKAFESLWEVVGGIMQAKDHIIDQLDKQGSNVKQSIGGQEGGEGYVLAHPGGDIKLVPRATFSKANRAVQRT